MPWLFFILSYFSARCLISPDLPCFSPMFIPYISWFPKLGGTPKSLDYIGKSDENGGYLGVPTMEMPVDRYVPWNSYYFPSHHHKSPSITISHHCYHHCYHPKKSPWVTIKNHHCYHPLHGSPSPSSPSSPINPAQFGVSQMAQISPDLHALRGARGCCPKSSVAPPAVPPSPPTSAAAPTGSCWAPRAPRPAPPRGAENNDVGAGDGC